MKVKEAIKKLLEMNQEAELVGPNGTAIHFFEEKVGFWDGSYLKLLRNESKPGYNITGFDRRRDGQKVEIHLLDVWDVIADNPEAVFLANGEPDDAGYLIDFRNQILQMKSEGLYSPELGQFFNKMVMIFDDEDYFDIEHKQWEKFNALKQLPESETNGEKVFYMYQIFFRHQRAIQLYNLTADGFDKVKVILGEIKPIHQQIWNQKEKPAVPVNALLEEVIKCLENTERRSSNPDDVIEAAKYYLDNSENPSRYDVIKTPEDQICSWNPNCKWDSRKQCLRVTSTLLGDVKMTYICNDCCTELVLRKNLGFNRSGELQ